MAKKNTRDYPKHPRFFKGGSVQLDPAEQERRAGERATREWLGWSRERALAKTGAGRPEDYERKPEEMVVQTPDREIIAESSDPRMSDPKIDPKKYIPKDI